LKAATHAAHERLDAHYSRFDLGQAEDYGRFLISHAAAFLPVETALLKAGAGDLVPGWRESMRAGALLADLEAMGLSVPPPVVSPTFATMPAMLGGLYVLEGSRLGGTMLLRSVGPGLPTGFLTPGPAGAWRAFTERLDDRLRDNDDLASAARSAIQVFEIFERSARALAGAAPRDA
jgi:heme oxygenase